MRRSARALKPGRGLDAWEVLVPPLGGDALLFRRVAHSVEPRLRRVLRHWKGQARARRAPGLGSGPDLLAEALRLSRGDRRVRFLAGGRLRGWMHGAEEALALLTAEGSDLVARVSDLGLLARLAPSGRIPRDFARRAALAARERLQRHATELPLLPQLVGAGILEVGPVERTRGTQVAVLGEDRRFARNVSHALTFLGAVWPEAAQMVMSRTWRVVPVEEPGVVSYSSLSRPGVSWIQRSLGKGWGSEGAMRFAEHLLHEGTHQRVHDLEVLAPIAAGEEDGPRFYSPWRREWRPLRGLLHGACTFTVGAAYFERTLLASHQERVPLPPQARSWLAKRFLEEMESLRLALGFLRRADEDGLLPVAGRRLLATVVREHGGLRAASSRRRADMRRTPAGRQELAAVEAHARELAQRPIRWS